MPTRNLQMPGNPRYQPIALQEHFGYDNLYKPAVQLECVVMQELGAAGFIPTDEISLLTSHVQTQLIDIATTDVVLREAITGHDIRALVQLIQELLPRVLRRWVHVPMTSYDVLDTTRSVQFIQAHREVVRPYAERVIRMLAERVYEHADHVQIGRTHGQHALPITVGFWLATILKRLLYAMQQADLYVAGLVGKVSGAVGAFNAQVGFGMYGDAAQYTFEDRVLSRMGIRTSDISTQIVPPEPMAYYLFSTLLLSAAIGQLGRDCRHLMRSEIGEVAEPFRSGMAGSSTMAHKRNPARFENIEGMYLRSKVQFGSVLETLISDHQRDLVGSSILRDFPILVINLVVQLETLLKKNKEGTAFLKGIVIDRHGLERNLALAGDKILAEPLYIALQIAGYENDAHKLISDQLMPATASGASLVATLEAHVATDGKLGEAWERVPDGVKSLLRQPSTYIGRAPQQAKKIAMQADDWLRTA